jgi:hypothetical protein
MIQAVMTGVSPRRSMFDPIPVYARLTVGTGTVFSLSISVSPFTIIPSIFIFILLLLLSGQVGEAWRPSGEEMLFRMSLAHCSEIGSDLVSDLS